jgi:hypothetical protein
LVDLEITASYQDSELLDILGRKAADDATGFMTVAELMTASGKNAVVVRRELTRLKLAGQLDVGWVQRATLSDTMQSRPAYRIKKTN